jgi:arylsulfatase A-like enzyme
VKERDICWYYPLDQDHFLGGKSAVSIRHGNWKLIEFLKTGEKQLFDLAADPSEARDLASARPDYVRELSSRLAAWRKSTVMVSA